METPRKYGVALDGATPGSLYVRIPIRKAGSADYATGSDWTPATGDVKVVKDAGVAANIATLPSYVNGSWQFTLSAAELTAKLIEVRVVDSATKAVDDAGFNIFTFGHASAFIPVDYSDGTRFGLTALPNAVAGTANGLSTVQTTARLFWPHGNVYFATTGGDAGNDGLSPASPKTLTSALSTAVEGDLVIIGPGTYTGSFAPTNTGVTMRGCGTSTILTNTVPGANIAAKTRTTIENLQLLYGGGGTNEPGIWAASGGASDVVVRNVLFNGFIDGIWSSLATLGLRAYDCHFVPGATGCAIDNGGGSNAHSYLLVRCTGRGGMNIVRANGQSPLTLVDCDFDAASGDGINMDSPAIVTIDGGSIRTRDATGFDVGTTVNAAGGKLILAGTRYRKSSVNDLGNVVVRMSGESTLATTPATDADMATLLARLTATRAGYLDKLNISGNVASQSDVNNLMLSASRRVVISTTPQWEIPEVGNETYEITVYTFDEDGTPTNADATPVLTATGVRTATNYSANIGAATNPTSGVYRYLYTIASTHTAEQIAIDVASFNMGAVAVAGIRGYADVRDFVAAEWTNTDQSNLTDIANFIAGLSVTGGNLHVDVKAFDTNPVMVSMGYLTVSLGAINGASIDNESGVGQYASAFGAWFNITNVNDVNSIDHVHSDINVIRSASDKYLTMIEDSGLDGNYEFTTGAMANVSVTLTQENIDAIVAGITATGLSTELVEKLAQADVFINYSVTPAVVIWYEKGTNTEIMRKAAYDRKGNPITSKLQQLGKLVDTPSP